ncbi:hypothetical protein QFC21_003170 [Naganishia friedmannii]|uniref:Uncharacterized protein n=1 Tax=Naganishia friedmannii TaxID=89922 RepID=A0ACC2VQY7_9TREE|nr:hypothetical protein QFC21_003170 [Naganishia friedmannii]
MFPSPRTRTPQSDTASTPPNNENNGSSSRSSAFSRFLKRASPGSSEPVHPDGSHSVVNQGESPARRKALHEAVRRDESRWTEETGRSESNDHRLLSRTTDDHSTATPSPQNRYGPTGSYTAYTTSSPSPLARRSESRQSLYPLTGTADSSVSDRLKRSQSRQSTSSASSSSVFDDPSDHRARSRATTPRPGDFHAAAAHEQEEGDGSFASNNNVDDDDNEDAGYDDGQSITPRSELKRWKPSALATSNNNDYNRSMRYASEPPSLPDSRASIGNRSGGGGVVVDQRTSRRLSLSHGLTRGNGEEDLELEPEEKVEMWRTGRESRNRGVGNGEIVARSRAALPSDFRNDFVSLVLADSLCAHDLMTFPRGEQSPRPVSRYSTRSTVGIDDSPEHPLPRGDQATYPATGYGTSRHRVAQSVGSSYAESPIKRSESLQFHGLLSDSPAPTSSIKRSATLHARHATESVASPVRARLNLGTSARSRFGTSEAGESPSSPVGVQRAESRRRRAALLEEMSTSTTPTTNATMMTPNRPASRMMHDRYALTDARPTSRMSMVNSSVLGIRPSTSMSSFRASDASFGGLDRQRYRSPIGSSSRGHTATSSVHELAYPSSSRWLRDRVPGPSQSRHERHSSGRVSSPTKSVISSVILPAGTSSRIVINRLLAALRESTGQETREMLQACIALQQNLADRPAGADEDDTEVQQFKQSCQTVAIDANQINANLKAALDVVTRLGEECEASSAEDAQIATISAVQKLGELIGSSSRASDEKIKSLRTVFGRLGSYTEQAAAVRSQVENTVDSLPIVQEDTAAVVAEEAVNVKDDVNDDVEAVEKAVEPAEAFVNPEVSMIQEPIMQESTSSEITPQPTASLVAREEPGDASDLPSSESVPLPMHDTPPGVTEPVPAEESAALVPAPSSTDISPALRTRARKASSSSISVNLSPSNSFKPTRSLLPPTLTHKASFMPSSLSLRTPTTALSRINAGTADEPGFDFDINPKPKAVVEQAVFGLNPLQLEIRTTPTAGRGVFATDDIPAAGTVVEESPVLVLTKKEWDDGLLNDGVLGGYGFNWTAGGMGVGLGIGEQFEAYFPAIVLTTLSCSASMFNHSPQPNVTFTRIAPRDSEKDKYPTLIFRTTKPIKKGEELYICYSADESKLWFSPNYNANGDPVEAAPEESEWCPPMMDEEEEPADAEQPAIEVEVAAKSEEAPTADPTLDTALSPQHVARSKQTVDQKYLDRKARKQSKREKKVKKPKADDVAVTRESIPETGAGSVQSAAATDSEVATTGGPNSPMSDVDFAIALSKLDLVPNIEIQAEDVEREQALATEEQASTEPRHGKRNNEVAWKLVHRVRGLVEAQEGDEDRTMDIWALAISDKKLMPVVLKYLKLNEKRFGALDHVKRVNHQKDQGTTLVAIAPADLIPRTTLQSELAEFSASLAAAEIIPTVVPATFARTLDDVAEKAEIWPVLLNAVPKHPADTPWTVRRRAWVRKGIQRLIELACNAEEAAGELPIAALAYSAPPDAQPSDPDLIPPTPHMRASGVDRRAGMHHPLKHAAMGCVAEVARLRTCSPFTETTSSTRNGADYLLTSMSLFITHEPCVMCTMALVHSRVKEVFFLVRNAEGGFGGAFDIHGHPGLNHKIDVFDCSALVEEGVLQRLVLPEGVEP